MESIIKKYLEGKASEAEQQELLVWLHDRKNRFAFRKYKAIWEKNLDKDTIPAEGKETWNKIRDNLLQKGYKEWQVSRRIQNVFRYAAIFLLLVSIGSFTYIYFDKPEENPDLTTKIMTDKGQISRVALPDGSFAWLNYGSEISYSNNFGIENREIFLNGEGYFMVTKNKKLPFIVDCESIKVKSLGTSFNVSSNEGMNNVEVVLESGLIELNRLDNESFREIITPGTLAILGKNENTYSEKDINTTKFTSWRMGIINIYNQSMEKTVERLELRYNQKFRVEEEVKNFHYTFTIRNESLEDIIKLMESITPVKAVQENEVIVFELDKEKASKLDNQI